MSATTRANGKATSKRAAESINAHDPAASRKAVLSCLPLHGDFTQPAIEALMRTLPQCEKPNGGRWSDNRVRGILAELEREGLIEMLPDDGGSHSRFRLKPVASEKRVQVEMF